MASMTLVVLLSLQLSSSSSSSSAAATTAATTPPVPAVTDAATLQLQQYDALRVARCAAGCWSQPSDAKDACETACLRSRYSKPGVCPDASARSAFDEACIEACFGDADCSSTDKCCTHACGVTCQSAQGLDAAPGLPAVPRNLTVSERRHGRVVVVEWSPGPGPPSWTPTPTPSPAAPVLYVLEERHHVGRHLSPERLGAWTARHRSIRPCATLRGVVRPGRWYQFRVAAVNTNGSRGFSPPSRPFRLSLVPRAPGPPGNLSVGALSSGPDGDLRAVLHWMPPASDLPVQRYKVFWSRRLDDGGGGDGGSGNGSGSGDGSGNGSGKQGSVLVHHQTVGGDVLQFMLKSLEPNSLYFLQVQAIAQFGRERLKGGKGARFLNTGNHPISGSTS